MYNPRNRRPKAGIGSGYTPRSYEHRSANEYSALRPPITKDQVRLQRALDGRRRPKLINPPRLFGPEFADRVVGAVIGACLAAVLTMAIYGAL